MRDQGTLSLGYTADCAARRDQEWWPALLRAKKTAIPVHRLVQTGADHCELRMGRIDQHIMIEPGNDTGHQEDGAAPFRTPPLTKFLADRRRHAVPSRSRRRRKDLVGQTDRKRYLDIMLVRRQSAATVHQFLEQCRGIVVAGIDQRTAGRIPPARRYSRARRVKNRIGAAWIANPETGQCSVENLCCHAALPYFRLLRTSRTSSAPISL